MVPSLGCAKVASLMCHPCARSDEPLRITKIVIHSTVSKLPLPTVEGIESTPFCFASLASKAAKAARLASSSSSRTWLTPLTSSIFQLLVVVHVSRATSKHLHSASTLTRYHSSESQSMNHKSDRLLSVSDSPFHSQSLCTRCPLHLLV